MTMSNIPDGAPATAPSSTAALAGNFAFRFKGYAMPNHIPYFLTGIGQFQIDAAGKLNGTHRSAIMPIQGQRAKLTTGFYQLTGSVTMRSDGTGDASILFTRTGGTGSARNVRGEFFVVLAGGVDRLWFISSGAIVVTEPGEPPKAAEELVNLEAVRIS